MSSNTPAAILQTVTAAYPRLGRWANRLHADHRPRPVRAMIKKH